jgi:low temperature requirement protein LtrA
MEARQTDGDSIDQEGRVTTIELFFDLVFVFTLTQLTALLEHDQTIELKQLDKFSLSLSCSSGCTADTRGLRIKYLR